MNDFIYGVIAAMLLVMIVMMIMKLRYEIREAEELEKRIDRFFDEEM